jgi:dTDP-4-amino-4,6-dideoxygalactose transaminase
LRARESPEILQPIRRTIPASHVHAIGRIERRQFSRACEFLPDLHRSPHLRNEDTFINSKPFHRHGLFLPSGPAQSNEAIAEVLDTLEKYCRSHPSDRWE